MSLPALIFIAVALSLLPVMTCYGPEAALIAESFTPRLRYSGTSLGYQRSGIRKADASFFTLSKRKGLPHLSLEPHTGCDIIPIVLHQRMFEEIGGFGSDTAAEQKPDFGEPVEPQS